MADIARNFSQAIEHYQARRFDKAERLLKAVISKAPGHADAFHVLGIIAATNKENDAAVRALKRAVALDPKNRGYSLSLAQFYHAQGNYLDALQVFLKLSTAFPADVDILSDLAFLQSNVSHDADAVDTLRKILTLAPNHVRTHCELGVILFRLGEAENSLAHLAQAVKLEPQNAFALEYFVRARALLGDVSVAAEDAAKAAAAVPNTPVLETLREDMSLYEGVYAWHTDGTNVPPADGHTPLSVYSDNIREALAGSSPGDLDLVFFHVSLGTAHEANRRYGADVPDYNHILAAAAAAGRRVAKSARVIMLTDMDSQFGDIGLDHIIRLPLKREWIMYERMRSQRAFAASGHLQSPTLFIDTDVVLNRSFEPIFVQDFDVGLTWRTLFPWMPINGGMILAKPERIDRVVHFFDQCLANYEAMVDLPAVRKRYTFDIREFQGDQLAMAAFVKWDRAQYLSESAAIDGVAVRFLPCEDMNFWVRPSHDPAVLAQKFALHFKGPSKALVDKIINPSRAVK